jgi:translation initiation factor 3 subunit C
MIHNGVLPASLDQIDHVVVFSRVELTKVQQIAQGLAEKAKNLNDGNQKVRSLFLLWCLPSS